MQFSIRELIVGNFSYKVVSLFIALILWITIMGRRDFTMTRNLEVEIYAGASMVVSQQTVDAVKVKVAGSRTALRRFMDASGAQVITIDLSSFQEGTYDVEIPAGKIDVPFGVKIVSLTPSHVQVKLEKR